MKSIKQILKKNGILIWLLTVLLATTAFISYGAYTGLKSVKRVVTTQASPGDLFSSNCMKVALANKRINTTEYTVTVCNYEQKNPMETNPVDISYELTAELKVFYNNEYYTMAGLKTLLGEQSEVYQAYLNKVSARSYKILKNEDDATGELNGEGIVLAAANDYRTVFSSESLKGGTSSTDKYKVVFDNAELEDAIPEFYIYLKAAPSSNLANIEGLIYAAKNASEVASWQGAFVEGDCATVDYDFYNYIISGSGIGTVDILWDPEWLEINPFFFQAMAENNVSAIETVNDAGSAYNGWKKASLTVDSTVKNRYELQLYKTKKDTIYTGESSPMNYIACMFSRASE